jgi:hypothetical protein
VNWRERATLLRADFRDTLAACEGRADLVFTSTPYADARGYGAAVAWTDADYARLGDAVFGALRPGGWAVINVDANVKEWRPGMGTERGLHAFRMLLDWADRIGFRVPDRLAFGRMGVPGEYAGRFRNDWEPLWWFQKPGGEGWFDKGPLSAPAVGGAFAGVRGRNATREGWYERTYGGEAAEEGLRRRGTLWDYGSVGNGHTGAPDIEAQGHPARWPYRLAEDVVRCFCPPDGLACDPFLGAGTSLVASLEHGRRFIGGDLYCRTPDPERGLDGAPWIEVAVRVMDRRAGVHRMEEAPPDPSGQARLFAPGSA